MTMRDGSSDAQESSSYRRATDMMAPVGNWWDGITWATVAGVARRASTIIPHSSTGRRATRASFAS
nr:hypothetical protein [Berryella intestinalis]